MNLGPIRRRRRVAALLAATVALGLAAPVEADDAVPDSCKVHPVHVVGPGCAPSLTGDLRDPERSYPNLSPDVTNVAIYRESLLGPEPGTFVEGDLKVFFDSYVRNIGTVPMELVADDPENPTTAMQCVRWTAHVCREHVEVGEYVWHQEHSHFHFADFADYQLRRLGPDGRPDYSDAGLVSISEKVSFCLVDASLIDPLKPSPPYYVTCGPTMQGVSPGWADVYETGYPGQGLSVEGLSDGRYAVVITLDHANRLYETDDTDNVVEAIIEISENMTQVALVGTNHP